MNLSKKVTTLILIITFTFSPVFSIKAEAQWVVLDPANLVQSITKVVKDYGLDGLAWQITNIIIQRMSASTVKWINSGFKGSPAYVTDPEAYFTKIGDDLSARYIFSNPNLDFLCEPYRVKIRIALQKNLYPQDERWRCSLTDVVDNIDDFMNDFERGGWDGFFELTQRSQNPLELYMMAENDLMREGAVKVNIATQELNQGQGFMSFKECEIQGEDIVVPGYPGDPTRPERRTKVCLKEVTNTPGSVISKQLNKQLGLGSDKLAVADEFNEIIGALLNQLVSGVFSGIGGGFRGLSRPSSTAEPSLQQRLATTTDPQLDYFGNPANTSILDKPVPDPYCLDQADDPNDLQTYDTDPNWCQYPRDTVELWPTDPSQTPPIP